MEKVVAALIGFFTIGVVVIYGDVIVTIMATECVTTKDGPLYTMIVEGAKNRLVRFQR